MAADLPDELRTLIERIEPAPSGAAADPADGALGRLRAWWAAHADNAPLVVQRIPPRAAADDPPVGRSADLADADADSMIRAAVGLGVAAADRAIDSGATLLVLATSTPLGSDRSTAARAALSLVARREASAVLPQPPGLSDRAWMTLCSRIRDETARAVAQRGDMLAALSALRAWDLAYAVGTLLGAAARRTACLLDGVEPLAAAVVAHRLAYRSRGWWLAASDSPDPGRSCAIDRVDLPCALPLGVADDRNLAVSAVLALLPTLIDDARSDATPDPSATEPGASSG